jgi:hypothetical protein
MILAVSTRINRLRRAEIVVAASCFPPPTG